MADPNKKEENITWVCPSCGQRYTAQPTTGLRTKCPNCGKEFYPSGIDVEDSKSRKLQDEIRERRRRETEADKEHE